MYYYGRMNKENILHALVIIDYFVGLFILWHVWGGFWFVMGLIVPPLTLLVVPFYFLIGGVMVVCAALGLL